MLTQSVVNFAQVHSFHRNSSEMLPVSVVFLLIVICLLWTFNKLARPKNFPPGPFLFPIVGVYPYFIRKTFLEKVQQWRQTYGNVMSLGLGSNRAILLHDVNIIKEAYNLEVFIGRPLLTPIREMVTERRRGISFAQGTHWEAQRRFALRHLRDFGFGKRSIEIYTHEDIIDLIGKFKKDIGQPISVAKKFNMSIVNSLWHIITGQRYDIDDPDFKTILHKLSNALSTSTTNVSAFTMDWALAIAPDVTGWTKFQQEIREAKEFIKEQISLHKKTFQAEYFRDFMDVYINEMEGTTDKNSSFYKTTGDENMVVVSLNLLSAGSETTSSTLTWALLYLSRNPSIQTKLQAEIDRVVGHSRLPSLTDQKSMPFASATILEILRKSSLLPLSAPHCTMTDVQFHGFKIPKNTIVLANLYDVHHNKKIWGDPEVFRPERFLTPDGKLTKDHPPVVSFSIGKRPCLGETLARNNIFLFLTSLFQVFDIKEPSATQDNKVGKEPRIGIFRYPPEFKVVFEERN